MDMIAPRPEPELEFFDHAGARIAVRHRRPQATRPTILFLPGYGSDMAGIKARAIEVHEGRVLLLLSIEGAHR